MSSRDPADLCPELQTLYKEWQMECHAAGLNAKAIVTWRSPTEQNVAKAEGLSNASAGESPHNCCDDTGKAASKAFDFGVFEDDGSYVRNGLDDRYRQAGEIGKGIGLIYGGDWIHFKDFDHLEMRDWKTA